MPNGLIVIENPVLPPRQVRVLSPTFHAERPADYMERLLAEWRPRALKGMTGTQLSPAWLLEQVPRMQPGTYIHMRVYRDDSQGALFDSDHFPTGHTPAYIADTFIKALHAQLTLLQTRHGHCIPVIEAWCELGAERDELAALVAIAQKLKTDFPDVLLGCPNQSIGTYNDEAYWRRIHESGLLHQENVIFLVHGYAAVVPWSGHLPGWQAVDVAARWPNLTWDDLPWNTYAIWDGEHLPETWTLCGLLRGLYFLQHVFGYDLSTLRFAWSEINLDMAGPNGFRDRFGNEASERGFKAYARSGVWERLKQPGMSDGEFMGHLLRWESVQMELLAQAHPCLQYMTEFVTADNPPLGWMDFATEGEPVDTRLKLEGPLTVDTECTLTNLQTFDINIRVRPVSVFQPDTVVGHLKPGESVKPIGQYTLPDTATVWYKVGENRWISAKAAVLVTGRCAALPTVSPDPEDIEVLKAQIAQLKAGIKAANDLIAQKDTMLTQQSNQINRLENALTKIQAEALSVLGSEFWINNPSL